LALTAASNNSVTTEANSGASSCAMRARISSGRTSTAASASRSASASA
jgi:hypothetical protein